jgi:SAM domain (Sterile alpha motif)
LEIADWLRELSLERYAETFRDNAIDVAVLPELRSPMSMPAQAPQCFLPRRHEALRLPSAWVE